MVNSPKPSARILPEKVGKFGSRISLQRQARDSIVECLRQVMSHNVRHVTELKPQQRTFVAFQNIKYNNIDRQNATVKLPSISTLNAFMKMQEDPEYLSFQKMIELAKDNNERLVELANHSEQSSCGRVTFDYGYYSNAVSLRHKIK